MNGWKKNVVLSLGVFGMLGVVGCMKTQNVNSESYLRCNDTSNGFMAEIESGYFHVYNNIIYYADKDNLETWVPVCNKPDCIHSTAKAVTSSDGYCNGYITSNKIIQKNGKLYDREAAGSILNIPSIVEISTDGSGAKKVYEIPWDEESLPSGGSQALYQDRMLFSFSYLDEKGYTQGKLIRLEEDENGEVVVDTLYEKEGNTFLFSGNAWWNMKGDDVAVLDIDWDKESGKDLWRNLWRVDGEELVKLEIPDEINLLYSYLSGNELTYYEQNDGFYKLNLDTGEKQLIVESQLKDACGYIYADDLMFEYDRYTDHIIKDTMHMKLYNGEKWTDVQIPEEIIHSERLCVPRAWASDRIFFTSLTEKKFTIDLYYMMLDEKNPKIVYAGQVCDKACEEQYDYEEEETNSGDEDVTDFEEIMVFDNEYGLLKVTGARQKGKDYVVDLFFEVGDSGREYEITIEALINGLQCHTNKSLETNSDRPGVERKSSLTFWGDTALKESGVTDIYSLDEITDIELIFYMNDSVTEEEILKKSVHIYPKGEDAVVHYTREPQETDLVFVNNEYVKVTVVGYDTTKVENDTPIFFVENKTDKDIQISVNAASVNGVQDPVLEIPAHEEIQGGACAFVKVVLGNEHFIVNGLENIWKEYNITDIGTIQTWIHIGYFDVGKFDQIGEPFVEEVITLYPKGEEHARDDARQPQPTDVVLVENEFVKLTLVGYQEYRDWLNNITIPNAYAKFVVENKTDEILYSKIPVEGVNGILSNSRMSLYTLLPGQCYTQIAGGIDGEPSKIEFLYQILDKDKKLLGQEYVSIYPLGEENAEIYKPDTESMEEILLDNEFFTIAVMNYEDVSWSNPTYEDCEIEFAFINKTDQMIGLEMSDIFVNGVEHIIEESEWNVKTYVAFANETAHIYTSVYGTIRDAKMTKLEDVEMTFKVYAYNYQDGSLGEELGNATVKFGPNK